MRCGLLLIAALLGATLASAATSASCASTSMDITFANTKTVSVLAAALEVELGLATGSMVLVGDVVAASAGLQEARLCFPTAAAAQKARTLPLAALTAMGVTSVQPPPPPPTLAKVVHAANARAAGFERFTSWVGASDTNKIITAIAAAAVLLCCVIAASVSVARGRRHRRAEDAATQRIRDDSELQHMLELQRA
jgi:hypothetical protein